MSKALGQEISIDDFVKTNLMNLVAFPALGEELVFRGLLQDLILKRLAKKVVQQISPQHASVVDGIRCMRLAVFFSQVSVLRLFIMGIELCFQMITLICSFTLLL